MALSQLTDSSPTVLALYFSVLIALYWIVSTIISYRRLRHIPGPLLASVSQWWLISAMTSARQHLCIAETFDKYGPLVRIGPNDIVTNDPELYRKMSGARSTYTRSDWYTAFKLNPAIDNLFSERGEARHAAIRSKCAAGYAGKENPGLEADVDATMTGLFDLIDEKYKSTSGQLRPLNFGQKIQFVTLDIISKIAFGRSFGFVTSDKDLHDYLAVTEANFPKMMVFTVIPFLGYFLRQNWVLALIAPTDRDVSGLGKMMGIAKEIVEERYAPDAKDKMDMLGSFKRHGLTRDEAESETLLQIIAGSDTTASALRTTFLQICGRPHVYNALRVEIEEAESKGRISSPIIKESEGRELTYLQACIREGLRFCPPITGSLSKLAPPEGDVYQGKFIPPGTHIGVSIWAMQRNKAVFGDDVELFRPERWLEADKEQRAAMDRVADVVFGAGRFTCLGRTIAQMELNKFIVEFLRRYDWTIVDVVQPYKATNYGLHFHRDFFMKAMDRLKSR